LAISLFSLYESREVDFEPKQDKGVWGLRPYENEGCNLYSRASKIKASILMSMQIRDSIGWMEFYKWDTFFYFGNGEMRLILVKVTG